MTTVAEAPGQSATSPRGPLAALALGALGVVYGDIGTSPYHANLMGCGPKWPMSA